LDFNKTSEDNIRKYSVNLPLYIWNKLNQVCSRNTRYGGHKSTYIRELIEDDLQRREHMIYQDPARKYSGVQSKIAEYPFFNTWFQKHKK
jgi:predicted DNA-binding protein